MWARITGFIQVYHTIPDILLYRTSQWSVTWWYRSVMSSSNMKCRIILQQQGPRGSIQRRCRRLWLDDHVCTIQSEYFRCEYVLWIHSFSNTLRSYTKHLTTWGLSRQLHRRGMPEHARTITWLFVFLWRTHGSNVVLVNKNYLVVVSDVFICPFWINEWDFTNICTVSTVEDSNHHCASIILWQSLCRYVVGIVLYK